MAETWVCESCGEPASGDVCMNCGTSRSVFDSDRIADRQAKAVYSGEGLEDHLLRSTKKDRKTAVMMFMVGMSIVLIAMGVIALSELLSQRR